MSNNPTTKNEWETLKKLATHIKQINITDLFDENDTRVADFTLTKDGLLFDYSKHHMNAEIMDSLFSLVQNSGFKSKRKAMFEGEKINHTEKRAVLHTALRSPSDKVVKVDDKNIIPDIHQTLNRIKDLSHKLHTNQLLGSTGKPIDTIISIGIGGSDLGPRMVFQALDGNYPSAFTTHFVSNIDGEDIQSALKKSNAETTLFIVISKSFKTQETLTNAQTARSWVQENLPKDSDIAPHFITVSSNVDAAIEFGMDKQSIYPMWDWVNGRFSLWSAVGLPLALHFGFDVFQDLLEGAHHADSEFLQDDLSQNIPVVMAVLGIWNKNFMQYSCCALLPYTEKLKFMPAYVQQLEMESNGKTIDNDGNKITNYKTCPVIFGEVGTNGQHSFYQLLHQGSDKVPCDFIGIKQDDSNLENHHKLLLSHMLAQGQAMVQGKRQPDAPYRYFDGNIPSTTMVFDKLDAKMLGYLIALYEHKTFVQGIVWNVNSFDQYGVELGKELSGKLEKNDISDADPSTKALYSYIYNDEDK